MSLMRQLRELGVGVVLTLPQVVEVIGTSSWQDRRFRNATRS